METGRLISGLPAFLYNPFRLCYNEKNKKGAAEMESEKTPLECGKNIADMEAGQWVQGFYLLSDSSIKTSANGSSFLTGTLTDVSGSIGFKVWDCSNPPAGVENGKIIKIRGEVSSYREQLQIIVRQIRGVISGDDYDLNRIVPVAPIDIEERFREVEQLVSSIEDDDYRSVAETMLARHKEAFLRIPAAMSMHHSFLSGLLMHTSNMMKMADFLSGLYPSIIDRSLLLTGTMIHDFAKDQEFSLSELGLVTDYSLKGSLLGHLVLGAEEVSRLADELHLPEEKSLLLQHLILSHHGKPEFGAAVPPLCAEAQLLSYIDLIDSRMEIFEEHLQEMEPGTFSSRIFALDSKIYRRKS